MEDLERFGADFVADVLKSLEEIFFFTGIAFDDVSKGANKISFGDSDGKNLFEIDVGFVDFLRRKVEVGGVDKDTDSLSGVFDWRIHIKYGN